MKQKRKRKSLIMIDDEQPWPPDDPAWHWLAAVYFAYEHYDPEPLLKLMHVPASALPFVKDLFALTFSQPTSGRPKRLRSYIPVIEFFARKVQRLRQEERLTVDAAVARLAAAGLPQYFTHDQLLAYCRGTRGDAQQRAKAKRAGGRRGQKHRPPEWFPFIPGMLDQS